MNISLFDSEIKLMELVWAMEPISAKKLSLAAAEQIGWNKNTTYTVIKKLEAKGYLHRSEPGYICTARITREQVQKAETKNLVTRLFGGSKKALFSALLDEDLTGEELDALRCLINRR
jgi:predicted transcriptional regulator